LKIIQKNRAAETVLGQTHSCRLAKPI